MIPMEEIKLAVRLRSIEQERVHNSSKIIQEITFINNPLVRVGFSPLSHYNHFINIRCTNNRGARVHPHWLPRRYTLTRM